ncbi:MAG: hypothetical protein FWD25_09535 [Clostridia bacterium]|nr:hypothetical protein [Clostridia bacterium]
MKKPYVVAVLCVVLSAALLVWGFVWPDAGEETPAPVFAMALTEDRGTAIMQFKQGAQTAADELGITLSMYTTEENAPPDAQLQAWLNDLEEVSALILPACGIETIEKASALAAHKRIPMALVGQEAANPNACVYYNRLDQGRALGEAILAAGAQNVAVYADAQAETQKTGALEIIGEPTYYYVGDPTDPGWEAPPEDTHALALTPEWGRALAQWGAGPVWTVDPGDDRIALLQSGRIAGVLMDMPFALGYLAVSTAYELSMGKETPPMVFAPSRVVMPETMYLAENIKVMFPLLQ